MSQACRWGKVHGLIVIFRDCRELGYSSDDDGFECLCVLGEEGAPDGEEGAKERERV